MLWECLECSTRYACDLQACPHCGSSRREENGMPKITVAHGATYKNEVPAVEEEVSEWPGKPSSASTQKQPSTSETNETTPQLPARTTASRSGKARKASSTARGVTTGSPATDESSDE